ncbi:hypothetical protein STEG23_027999, partial [Scotinomys teguina]
FQKATNNKKQFLRLQASENSSQKVLQTETQGINTMQVADALSVGLIFHPPINAYIPKGMKVNSSPSDALALPVLDF